MADAIPAAPTTAAVTTAGGGGPVPVSASAANTTAQAVEKLTDGAVLEGTAAARAVKGSVEIVTADGSLQIKAQPGTTLPAFAAGSKLTLQMVGGGTNGQLYLVAVNGRPLVGVTMAAMNAPLPGLMLPLPPGPATPAGQRPGPITPPGLPQNPGIAMPGMASAAPLPLPLGLSATLIRPAIAPGETAPPTPNPVAQPAAPPAPGTSPAAAPAPINTAGLPPDLPAGTRLTVRIAGVTLADGGGMGGLPGLPPGSVSPPVAAPPGPDASLRLLPGEVIAHPPGGQAVVRTPVGTLAVPTHADLPAGTRLTLEVVGQPLPPLPPSTPPATAAASGLGAQGWPVLTQALDVLANANQPQALEQLLRVIPQPDQRLAASMAVFGGALRAGDVRALLPDGTVRGLEKAGRRDMAGRLKADLEALAEEAGRPLGNGDWRLYTMPMLGGGAVEPVRLYVRKGSADEGDGKTAGGKGDDHRFVVDLNLTHLGRLQLDGLVRRQDKLFDLIIRTDAALDPDLRRDILGIFTNASELVGTKGTVSFQAGGRWMEFPPAPPAPTRIEV